MPLRVGIVSGADDLHAIAILATLQDLGADTFQIPTDGIAGSGLASWTLHSAELPSTCSARSIDVRTLDAIWWRRPNAPQSYRLHCRVKAQAEMIDNDSRAALLGILLTQFRGQWVSHPTATSLAENKLVQLEAAHQEGFRVPRTLVTQQPDAVRELYRELDGRVVVKPLKGSGRHTCNTAPLTRALLRRRAAIAVAPAIYQERIEGTRHLRVQVFGSSVLAVELESNVLDWRGDLRIPMRPVALSGDLQRRLRQVLRRLKLRMGIFDLKLDETGTPHWLEVNPQGQFLFLQGITGLDLRAAFAHFLLDEARIGRRLRHGPH